MFSYKFCEIFKTTYFAEHPQTAVSLLQKKKTTDNILLAPSGALQMIVLVWWISITIRVEIALNKLPESRQKVTLQIVTFACWMVGY